MDSHQACEDFQKHSKTILQHLENMWSQLDNYRPLLKHSASSAEFEIKANFHNLIETLNNRQATLLRQLDFVFKDKIALIERQQQTVHALISKIMSSIASGHTNDPKLPDLLSRACSEVVAISSDPFISFRNEQTMLYEAILKYGRLVSCYSGHFADPSRPSTSLPSAVEEEEEDDDQTTHGRRVVLSHPSPNSDCSVKPTLRRWLAQPNVENELRRGTCNSYGSHIQGLSDRSSQMNDQPAVDRMPTCSVSSPVPGWVNYVPADQVRSYSNVLFPHPSFWAQEKTDSAVRSHSASFSVISEASHTNSLRDWLFCDPQQVSNNMPGLTKPFPTDSQRGPFISQPDRLSNWLSTTQPTNVQSALISAPTTTVSGQSPLSSNVTRSSPIDLNRWLIPAIEDQRGADEPTESIQSISVLSDEGQMTVEDTVSETSLVPDCCIYSQCRGGPGGPTCCGARLMFAAADNKPKPQQAESSSSEVVVPVSNTNTLTKNNSIRKLKHQFNQITSTHWTRWLSDQPTGELVDDKISFPWDKQTTYSPVPPDQTQIECPSPPKRPSLAGDVVSPEDEYYACSLDYYSTKNLETPNLSKTADYALSRKVELDEGLLRRMSTLSTIVVDSPLYRDWLVDMDST